MKINHIEENSNRYRRVKRSLFGDETRKIKTFAIISPENPLGWKDSTEDEFIAKYNRWLQNKGEYNQKVLKDLKGSLMADRIKKTGEETLKFGHFNYVQIKGSYGDKEKTLIIFNLSLSDAKIIASNYGQESFFYGKTSTINYGEHVTSKIAYYKTTNACKSYDLIEISNTITDEEHAVDFFSKYGFKYRINMREFGDDVIPVENNDEFEKSIDENATFQHRAMHRMNY